MNSRWWNSNLGPQGQTADISLERGESPSFGGLSHPLALGGIDDAGVARGSFVGRLAHFALWERPLDPRRVPAYRSASISRSLEDLPSARPSPMDEEGRALFLDDVARLVQLTDKGSLSRSETRDISILASRWLSDHRPLLHRVADHYGTQISLPDLSPLREVHQRIIEDRPIFLFSSDRWEGDHKLGGGHFDPDDRKRWQKELNALATETQVGGEQWLDVKMLTLARALRFAVESCGFVSLAKFGL